MQDDTRELTQEFKDYLCDLFQRRFRFLEAIEFMIEEGFIE